MKGTCTTQLPAPTAPRATGPRSSAAVAPGKGSLAELTTYRSKTSARRSDKAPRGGFNVQFSDLGPDDKRARYESESRTIYVNLEHPQVAAARWLRGVEDATFRRLAYEVAFAEYALGLAHMLDEEGQFIETFEPIRDIRDTIDRVTRAGAALYQE